MLSTSEVGTVFQFSRGLNQYAIKCSRRGEAEGFVEVIAIVGRDLYTVLHVPTEELKLLPNQEQYKGTPLAKHLENFLKGCHSNYNTAGISGRTKGTPENGKSDGSKASYYDLPKDAKILGDLINHRNMNHGMGEIFCAAYRYGMASHSDQLRDAKKIKFYIEAEIKRLEAQQ
jgi:hypothetical protein